MSVGEGRLLAANEVVCGAVAPSAHRHNVGEAFSSDAAVVDVVEVDGGSVTTGAHHRVFGAVARSERCPFG